MDNQTLIKNINKDIKDIEIIVNSYDNNSKIHQIDIDLALSKIRNLYDKFLLLNNINNKFEPIILNNDDFEKQQLINVETENKIKEKSKKMDSPKEKEGAKKKIIIKRTKGLNDDNLENVTLEPEKINHEFVEKVHDKKEIKEEKIEKDDKSMSSKKITAKNNIVADSFKMSQRSINEQIAENKKLKDLATKLKGKHISDINKIISLNDKVKFIKVLFKGDNQLYNKTIDAINSFDNIDMVVNFFNDNFDWDKDNNDYISFLELISRRFL